MPETHSWEPRLRQDLRDTAEARSVETEAALRAVLARAAVVRRRRRARRMVIGFLAVAASVVVLLQARPLLGGRALPPTTVDTSTPSRGSVVATPAGAWRRDVTGGPAAGGVDGRWTMRLRDDGTVDLAGPSSGPATDGVSWAVEGDRLRLNAFVNDVCGNEGAGTYRWSRGARGLTLAAVSDTCRVRVAVFAGTWAPGGAP
jgi:hypothetical protein